MKPYRNEITLNFRSAYLLMFAGAVVVSCGSSTERDALCMHSARWNIASSDVAEVLSDLDGTSPGELQSVFSEVVETLALMSEIAPTEVVDDLERLSIIYGTLESSFADLKWRGDLASKDAGVISSGVRLKSEEIQSAQLDFSDYLSLNCGVKLDEVIVQIPSFGTTLPDPILQNEAIELPPVGYDNDQSVIQAFGYVVVERFGVAITADQANCVGQALVESTSQNQIELDEKYWQMLQTIFDQCTVEINIDEQLAD